MRYFRVRVRPQIAVRSRVEEIRLMVEIVRNHQEETSTPS